MTNYSRGRAWEYKTMNLLRAEGYVCSRSAMSHGPVDVFAAKAGKILLIQVKSGSARAKKYELNLLKKWAAAFNAEGQVWSFRKRGQLVKVVVRAKEPRERGARKKATTPTTGDLAAALSVLPKKHVVPEPNESVPVLVNSGADATPSSSPVCEEANLAQVPPPSSV
jgi:Holliday junction resolvase